MESEDSATAATFKLAVNLRFTSAADLGEARMALLHLLRNLACHDDPEEEAEEAILPAPVSCEEPSQFEAWHEGIDKALAAMKAGEYRKVVLARAAQFTFPRRPRPLDLVLRLRAHYGYLFCLQIDADRAFLGCTPEQLFRIADGTISTEALAGTRPRGATAEEDKRLGEELMASTKDRFENRVTAESIEEALRPLAHQGKVERFPAFVLRLQHVQHICHKISARLSSANSGSNSNSSSSLAPAFKLLAALHPTPAVAGEPRRTALQAIRALEPFDRGFYAGPVGYISPSCSEFAVAIRSVLIIRDRAHVFAGAGIVPGSTAEGEWAEIGAKMANFVRMFPAPAPPLRSLPNLATLWATLVIEELARHGVTHFCIAPGSRSTPLVTAAARHPHTTLMVHHDERGAGFYCLGYARARGRPAAVIVTSGTAVANLLPAAVEAATDRVPLLLLTADRPPEQRDCGANQTIAQANMFQSYARWQKDFPCPTHEILASSLLSDIDYAVSMARGMDPGPVHLNFMLRENLAPEGGVVRDTAVPGLSSEWPDACLGNRRFAQWERSLQPYTTFPRLRPSCPLRPDLLEAINGASQGLLVLGRLSQRRDRAHVRWLAQELQWPVFADVASGLRGDAALQSLLIGPYEALLGDSIVSSALNPDVVLQIGSPLVSKRLPKFVVASRVATLIHVIPSPARRDPELSATHHVCSDIPTFVRALDDSLDWNERRRRTAGSSGLLPLLKKLATRLEENLAEELGAEPLDRPLNEPMVAHLVARKLPAGHGLFLSNSMPVRDVDAFACSSTSSSLQLVAMNRGASGIDGILSTAMGYSAGLNHRPVTLLIGDMACLHDLNALHALASPTGAPPVTVVLVNNGGGGIFSFLPIARHADVFSPYFDSPHDLNFGPVIQAFNIPYRLCRSAVDLVTALQEAQHSGKPAVLEVMTDRAQNVRIHRQLGSGLRSTIHKAFVDLIRLDWVRAGPRTKPSLLLLHGFMGCKEDWASLLWARGGLAQDYDCLAVDLPGHGTTAMAAEGATSSVAYSLPVTALVIVQLLDRLGIARCAVMGYSMGGRLAAYLAHQYPERVSTLIMISAHPGLRTESERLERQEGDRQLAERVSMATAEGGGEKWDAFLRWWYSKPLWGRLAERTPAYARMMRRRRASLERSEDPGGLVRALLGLSVAQQPGLWDFIRSGQVPTLVIYGAADVKYAALGEELRGGLMADGGTNARTVVEVKCVDDAGHAVLTEKETEMLRETSAFLRRHLEEASSSSSGGSSTATTATSRRVATLTWTPLALPLKRPMTLSTGTITERRGFLIILQSDSGIAGIGEVSPLPGFSQESLLQAELQLKELAGCLAGRVLPKASKGLGAWIEWLASPPSTAVLKELLPSVRAGLEMALVHLLAQEYKVGIPAMLVAAAGVMAANAPAGRGGGGGSFGSCNMLHTGRVRLNGLVLRQQHANKGNGKNSSSGGSKVKVGGRPIKEDLIRVNGILAALGPRESIRLDANQAWSLEEAVCFIRGLTRPELIEYIEEPCHNPSVIPELYNQVDQAVKFALDESLSNPSRSIAELVAMSGLAALVLKPTVLGGHKHCFELHLQGAAKGLGSVVSSSFESSIGLSHLTLLASVLNSPSSSSSSIPSFHSAVGVLGGSTMHGLGTYDIFDHKNCEETIPSTTPRPLLQEVLAKSNYGALVETGGKSFLVDVLGCQELLDAFVSQSRHQNSDDGEGSQGGSMSVLSSAGPGKEEEEKKEAEEEDKKVLLMAAAVPEHAGLENGQDSALLLSSSRTKEKQHGRMR